MIKNILRVSLICLIIALYQYASATNYSCKHNIPMETAKFGDMLEEQGAEEIMISGLEEFSNVNLGLDTHSQLIYKDTCRY